MLLVKTYPYTPKKRWQRYIKIDYFGNSFFRFFYKTKTKNKTSIGGKKLIRNVKFFHKRLLYNFYIKKPKLTPFFFSDFGLHKNRIKEFGLVKNLFNQLNIYLTTVVHYPGFILYNYKNIILKNKFLYGQFVPVKLIPLNFIICFIFNNTNQYAAFSKSSGCNSVKKKIHKKLKLTYIQLPSKKTLVINSYAFCIFSENNNFYLNKIVEGGWGYSYKLKKLIHVRGVAKNPVDHPNGGRTKAKQPEKTPWGLIAKFNK